MDIFISKNEITLYEFCNLFISQEKRDKFANDIYLLHSESLILISLQIRESHLDLWTRTA